MPQNKTMEPDTKPQAIDHVQLALKYFQTDHQRWQKELEYARQELEMVIPKLEDLAVLLSDRDFLADLEHFQNLFISKRELVDTLLHKVGLDGKETARLIEDPGTSVGHINMQKHLDLGNEMVKFSRLYIDLWYSFNEFLLRNL